MVVVLEVEVGLACQVVAQTCQGVHLVPFHLMEGVVVQEEEGQIVLVVGEHQQTTGEVYQLVIMGFELQANAQLLYHAVLLYCPS